MNVISFTSFFIPNKRKKHVKKVNNICAKFDILQIGAFNVHQFFSHQTNQFFNNLFQYFDILFRHSLTNEKRLSSTQ